MLNISRIGSLTPVAILLSGLAGLAQAGNPAQSYTPDLLPPNPETGECYTRVRIAPEYKTRIERVIIEDAYSTLVVDPEQVRTRRDNIMVKEPSVRYVVRQPRYKSVSEPVMIRPAYEKLSVVPPRFDIRTETVQLSRPRLVWKKGNPAKLRAQGYIIHSTADAGTFGRGYRSTVDYGKAQIEKRKLDNAVSCGETCEIWCLVEEPGASISYNRKVMSAPGNVQRVAVPAKFTQITKQVLADPGGVQEIPVPAEYRSIEIEEVLPGRVRESHVPPRYADVAGRVPITSERYEWRRVVCKPGTHPQDRLIGSSRHQFRGPARASSGRPSSANISSAGAYSSGSYSSQTYSIMPHNSSVRSVNSYQSPNALAAPASRRIVTERGYYGVDDKAFLSRLD